MSNEAIKVSYQDYDDYEEFLDEFQKHIDDTIDELIDFIDNDERPDTDYTPYEVKIEFNGKCFNFGSGAAEHNGLLEFVSFVREQQ